ncbi:hypothetical protein Tco_1501700 [Tanacetum coccineum]
MSITKEQQQALDDALVPREQRLRIGNSFLISTSVPAIYMHEFWATVSYHKHCIKFKMNKKNYSFDLETFRDMLQIYPNLPGQKFEDPPFEEDILAFIRELGYPGDIKSLFDVMVDTLYQPWRTFRTIINKCLSGKVTGLDQLRLSRAQIIWGMYNQKKVDYVYLLWEDLVYQIENKVLKKNKYMYYPIFTKVIINHFMSKDQSIPRRNKVDWHMAKDDPILTTMRFIPKHETVQKYDDILPDTLTNQVMKDSDAYKIYHDFATGKVIPKPKYVRRSTKKKTDQAPIASPGKRLKATAKVAKSGKKKQHAQGLETLSEIALSEAEQMKIVTKRSKTQFHNSHASGSGANEGTGKSSDEDDDDEVSLSKDDDDNAYNEDDDGHDDDNEQTKSDNDGEDFVHPKFSTHDEEERQEEEDKEEEGSDLRVQTPSHFESTDDEAYNEVTQGDNVKGEELNEEETNEEDEVNELYRDVNVNLERRDTEMTDALQTNVQGTQVIEDTHVIITAVTPEVQHQSSSVSSGFISNMLNPNPDTGIDSILNLNTESTSLVDVPVTTNVEMPPSSVTTLPPPPIPPIQPQQQTPVSTPTIVPIVSLIPGIVDKYLANQMNEVVKVVVQLQSDRLRIKEQVTKILPKIEKSVNKQLEAEVLIRSSNKAKTSYAIAANLSEFELKKILIDKMENNKSIDRSVPQKNLYKALVDAYESDKYILASYEDTVTLKRRRDDEDEDEEPFAGSNRGPREEDLEKNLNQLVDETTQHPDWFQKPIKPPTPDRDWNKTLPAKHDFLAFVLNRLKVDTLTLELLASLKLELMKGLCKSLVKLEYFLEEVCKATTDQLDWNNPEGQQYPHDLHKPLPLIPNSRGR